MASPKTYAGIVETSQPAAEPIDLATVKNFLKLPSSVTGDDTYISDVLIPAARRHLESVLGITLAQRNFAQYENGFPFFPYFQSPYAPLYGAAFPFYFGYGPIASYPYPAIGGLQNQLISPFDIILLRNPVTAVASIQYIGTDGNSHSLSPGTDFTVAFARQPCIVSPLPGQRWPVGIMANSTVQISFTAGYKPPATTENPDAEETVTETVTAPTPPNQITSYTEEIGIPPNFYHALLFLVMHWYRNREPVVGSVSKALENHLNDIIFAERILDF